MSSDEVSPSGCEPSRFPGDFFVGNIWKERTMGFIETLVRAVLAVFFVALGIVALAFVFTVLASLTG